MKTYKFEFTVDADNEEQGLIEIGRALVAGQFQTRKVRENINDLFVEEETDIDDLNFDEDPQEGDRGSHQDQAPEDFID